MAKAWQRMVIVGAGLLGASMAGGARARGLVRHAVGVGRSEANLATAVARGLVDEASTDLARALEGADLVVLATPVATAVSQLAEVAAAAAAGALVTDVGSVKRPIVEEAARLGLGPRFLGAHPLAGKAETGAGSADPDLFVGRRVVLTPTVATPPGLVEDMRALWEGLGSRVECMDAGFHDEVLARSSHLPQMVAFALCAAVDASPLREDVARLAAGGFRDTTRLGASDADMWADIAGLNRAAVVDAIDEFASVLAALRAAVADGDEGALRALVAASRRLRAAIATEVSDA